MSIFSLGFELYQSIFCPSFQTPTIEVGSTSVIFSLPSDFPQKHELIIELWQNVDFDKKRSYSLITKTPSLEIEVKQGTGYLYRYKTVNHKKYETEWSIENTFTSRTNEGISNLLRSNSVCLDKINKTEQNILVVGTVGCGKSSFINTLYRAHSGERKNPAKAFYSSSHTVTTKPSPYQLKNTKINIIDTPGLEKGDEEKLSMVKDLIKGNLRDEQTALKPDVVVFVHAYKDSMASQQSLFTESGKVFDMLRQTDLPVIAVLTHADCLGASGQDAITIENYLEHPRVVKASQQFKEISGIDVVIPFINYTNLDINEERNKIALSILDLILDCC